MSKVVAGEFTNAAGSFSVSDNTELTGNIRASAGTNWVGTVSQSSTSAIVERGSNANGEYVRFADGTQICWLGDGSFNTTDTASYTIQGINFFRNLRAWTFPIAFSTTTGLVVTNNVGQNLANSFVSTYSDGVSTTGVNLQNLSVSAWSSFARLVVFATAVGRWY